MNIYMSVGDNNRIGSRGEHIFAARVTQDFEFDVTFLGEKHEATDFCLEFVDRGRRYMFFVQVKSTNQNVSKNNQMPIYKLDKDHIEKIINNPYPTYLAGVNIRDEEVYFMGLFQYVEDISYIPKKHMLSFVDKQKTAHTIKLLKEDVIACWQVLEPDANKKTEFISKLT